MDLLEYQTMNKAKKLFENNIISDDEIGKASSLLKIHQYLFENIFEFAVIIRNRELSKDNFRFAATIFIESNLEIIDDLAQSNFDEIIQKYVEMNIVHPFLEGNGRSMRIWLDFILKKELKLCIDWAKVDKFEYLQAMKRSPISTIELKVLLKKALSDKINDRIIFFKGIEQSYYYEIADEIEAELLKKNVNNNFEKDE